MRGLPGAAIVLTGYVLIPALAATLVAEEPRLTPYRVQLETFDGPVHDVAFSPDGTALAVAAGREVRTIDPESGKPLRQMTGARRDVQRIAYSPDGRYVAATGEDDCFRLFDAATGNTVHVFRGDIPAQRGVGFFRTDKGLMLCSTNFPKRGNQIELHLWNVAQRRWEYKVRKSNPRLFYCLAVSPGGRHIAIGELDGLAAVYEVAEFGVRERFELRHHENQTVTCVAFSPESERLLSCGSDNTIQLWSVANGTRLLRLDGPTAGGPLRFAHFVPDADVIVSATGSGLVQLWNVTSGRLLTSRQGGSSITALAVSGNGRLLATGDRRGQVTLWELPRAHDSQDQETTSSQ